MMVTGQTGRPLRALIMLALTGLTVSACGGQTAAPAGGGPAGTGAGAQQAPASGQAPGGDALARGGVFTMQAGQYPSLDPHQVTYSWTVDVVGPAVNNIVRFDPTDPKDSKVIPDLAEKWTTPDDKTYVFTFRKGVKWHDGANFTSEDAKFTIDRVKNPPQGVVSPRKDWFREVASLETPDPLTLKITLNRAQASFLSMLAVNYNAIVPKHILEKNQDAIKQDIIGTGAMKKKDLDFNVGGTLVRNPDAWDMASDGKPKPYFDEFKWLVIPDTNTAFAAFRTAKLDVFSMSRAQREQTQKEMPQVRIDETPGLCLTQIRMRQDRAPFDSVKVRQAIALTVDRDAIIKGAASGRGDPASTMPVTGNWNIPMDDLRKLPGYRADKSADLAKAKELMKEAGYPSGFKVTQVIGEGVEPDTAAVIVAEQLKPLGIETTMQKFDVPALVDRYNKGDFEYGTYTMCSSVDDPDDFMAIQYVTGGGRNYGKFSNAEVDRAMAVQSAETNAEKRKQLVLELNRKVITEYVPQVELYWGRNEWGIQPWVKDWHTHYSIYTNTRKTEVWIDSKLKK